MEYPKNVTDVFSAADLILIEHLITKFKAMSIIDRGGIPWSFVKLDNGKVLAIEGKGIIEIHEF